jgi:hypothetical protein
MAFSPLVGVFGHRQIGKTTYLTQKIRNYFTLDDEKTLQAPQLGPSKFLGDLQQLPTAIDECQVEPRLFPALKEWVRLHLTTTALRRRQKTLDRDLRLSLAGLLRRGAHMTEMPKKDTQRIQGRNLKVLSITSTLLLQKSLAESHAPRPE